MAAQGLESRVPLDELAIMGVAEVLPRARRIFRHVAETVADIDAPARPTPSSRSTARASPGAWRSGLRRRGRARAAHPLRRADGVGMARRPGAAHGALVRPSHGAAAVRAALFQGGRAVLRLCRPSGDRERRRPRRRRRRFAGATASRRGERCWCCCRAAGAARSARLLPVFKDAVGLLAARYPGLRVVLPTTETVHEAGERRGRATGRCR